MRAHTYTKDVVNLRNRVKIQINLCNFLDIEMLHYVSCVQFEKRKKSSIILSEVRAFQKSNVTITRINKYWQFIVNPAFDIIYMCTMYVHMVMMALALNVYHVSYIFNSAITVLFCIFFPFIYSIYVPSFSYTTFFMVIFMCLCFPFKMSWTSSHFCYNFLVGHVPWPTHNEKRVCHSFGLDFCVCRHRYIDVICINFNFTLLVVAVYFMLEIMR